MSLLFANEAVARTGTNRGAYRCPELIAECPPVRGAGGRANQRQERVAVGPE
jgi:hypothetical protein